MNIKKITWLLFASLLLCLSNSVVAANFIQGIRSNSLDEKLQIVIDLEQYPEFNAFALSNPVRLVVDVKGRPQTDFTNRLSFSNRGVSRVRTSMSENDQVRVVLDLVKDFQWKAYTMKPDGRHGHRVVIDVVDYPQRLAKHTRRDVSNAAVSLVSSPTVTRVANQPLQLESIDSLADSEPEPMISGTPRPVIKEAYDVLSSTPNPVSTPDTMTEVQASTSAQEANNRFSMNDAVVEPIQPTAKRQPSATQVASTTADLSQTTSSNSSIFDDPNFKTVTVSAVEPLKSTKFKPKSTETTLPKRQHRKEIIVLIDPGHGGKDPGATGQGGTTEKYIVLQIAKRLKKRINNTHGMRAILTRNRDKYITLRGRLKLVEKYQPDLFVSIHADAAQNRSAKGSSVFILSNRGASSKTAKWIAQRENAVDAKYGSSIDDFSSDVSNVLLGMQQDITIESSHALAKKTLRRLKGIGKVHKRRVERAGFAVLKYPSIPSMLVETAFLSNPEEERKLKRPSYQAEIASAIASGIKEYFRSQGRL